MRKKRVATKLLQATEGLVATATDLVLFFTILPFALPGAYTHGQVARRVEDVTSLISEDLNYRTIKNTIKKLVEAGLIAKNTKRNALEIAITKLGKERIDAIIPTYQEERPWDGHLYSSRTTFRPNRITSAQCYANTCGVSDRSYSKKVCGSLPIIPGSHRRLRY